MDVIVRLPPLPAVPAAAIDRAKLALARAIGDSRVAVDADACGAFAKDESEADGRLPDIVVHAESLAHIEATLRIAEEHGVPVTPRAGGTGRSGGAIPAAGGIVLATAKLSRIKDLDRKNLLAVVEPGVVTGDLHAAAEAEGLFYPPDPNSWKSCMIGGNVAENAGGPRAFKYGTTREYVLGVEACLMGGHTVRSGKRTVKGVTGYDVTALLVGSEGTLGVFSEITLKLLPKPREIATALGLFRDSTSALDAVTAVLHHGLVPRCMEFLDPPALDALRSQGVAIDARAAALLLIELDGGHVEADLMDLGEVLSAAPGSIDVQVAQDAARRAALWEARRAMSPTTRKLAKYKISEDVVVPRSAMSELLDRVAGIGLREGVRNLTYGHAGDGNLHVNFLWNDRAEDEAVERAVSQLMNATLALGGTLSGEHGIGLTKQKYITREQGPALVQLEHGLKRVFDPKGLLNPGKIFPPDGTHHAC